MAQNEKAVNSEVIRQIKELNPDKVYAIVFDHPLSMKEIDDLRNSIDNAEKSLGFRMKLMIVSGATVIDMNESVIVANGKNEKHPTNNG